jgi:L-aminopeptidase/D-esterase-like protein
MNGTLTDIKGLQVGHYTDKTAATGCTVILCPPTGAVAGYDVRGSAPGTRETDLLRPGNLVQHANAIVLSGGSAFGLDTASGVVRYLEERDIGFHTHVAKVPIVPAAILFDLGLGQSNIRPNADSGYEACLDATEEPVNQGSVGAGTGATIAKILGPNHAIKGGLGSASIQMNNGYIVAALFAVNAIGDVINPKTGETVAGPRNLESQGFHNTIDILQERTIDLQPSSPTNTTIGVVATDAPLNKEQVTKFSQMANSGMARALRPAHTMADGDLVFGLSVAQDSDENVDLTALGALAAHVTEEAIMNATRKAHGLYGVPSAKEWLDGHS